MEQVPKLKMTHDSVKHVEIQWYRGALLWPNFIVSSLEQQIVINDMRTSGCHRCLIGSNAPDVVASAFQEPRMRETTESNGIACEDGC